MILCLFQVYAASKFSLSLIELQSDILVQFSEIINMLENTVRFNQVEKMKTGTTL